MQDIHITREGTEVGNNGIRLFAVMAALVLGMTVPASATVLNPHVVNRLEFSYVENIFDANGVQKGGILLAPGDHLIGIISVSRIIARGETLFTSSPTSQLTGIYAHKVLSSTPNGPSSPASAPLRTEYGNPDPGLFTNGTSTINLAAVLEPGAILALWLDQGSSATSFTTGGTLAEGVARATDGLPFLSAGIGGSGYFHSHTNPNITMEEILGGALIGHALAGLEVLTNGTGHSLTPIPNPGDPDRSIATQLALSCDLTVNPVGIFSPQNSPWTLAGTGTAQIYPTPEPSTLALFGAAGTVMALWRLRKRP